MSGRSRARWGLHRLADPFAAELVAASGIVRADITDLRLPTRPFVVANPPFEGVSAVLARLAHRHSRLVRADLVVPVSVTARWSRRLDPSRWFVSVQHHLPRSAFRPAPRVDCCVVRIAHRPSATLTPGWSGRTIGAMTGSDGDDRDANVTTHQQVLGEVLGHVAGRDVLDVGCGAGSLVRWLRSIGARVTGAECGGEMRRRAIEADPEHAGDYVDAAGQDLPFDDGAFDAVIYSYSLHHVPTDEIPDALREARRVLRPGGRLVVVEPAVDPPDRAVAPQVVDETAERTAAQAALSDAAEHGFAVDRRDEYPTESRFPDFETWVDDIVGIDPDRAAAMSHHREHARANFERLAERRGDEWIFRRTNLLTVLTAR